MNWRPERWAKLKTKAHNALIKKHGKQHWPIFDDDYMEAGADAILEKIYEEIGKVENPSTKAYKIGKSEAWVSTPEYKGFEDCRQKILTLLRK